MTDIFERLQRRPDPILGTAASNLQLCSFEAPLQKLRPEPILDHCPKPGLKELAENRYSHLLHCNHT
jgi:hypothetical protein